MLLVATTTPDPFIVIGATRDRSVSVNNQRTRTGHTVTPAVQRGREWRGGLRRIKGGPRHSRMYESRTGTATNRSCHSVTLVNDDVVLVRNHHPTVDKVDSVDGCRTRVQNAVTDVP